MMEEQVSRYSVNIGNRTLPYYVMRPDKPVTQERRLLLLTFTMDWTSSLTVEPFCIAASHFVQRGHYAVSFDLPCHGERSNGNSQAIRDMCQAVREGADPFALFLENATAVIDQCIARGLAVPGRVVVSGTSRGAYFALRLLAADARVIKAAGFAPVTDWNDLAEFAVIRSTEAVNRLQLSHFIGGMANKPLFIAVGHQDTRISTVSCCRFFTTLYDHNIMLGHSDSLIEFYCTDDEGHTMGNRWYEKGSEFLLS